MEIYFKSRRNHNLTFLIKLWALNCFIAIAGIILASLFFKVFSSQSPFLFGLIFIGFSCWVDIAQKDRINEITIDSMNRMIYYQYYDINEGQVKKSFSFDGGRIKILKNEIYFFEGKKNTFSISKAKDGFDSNMLDEIKKSLEAITRPVSLS